MDKIFILNYLKQIGIVTPQYLNIIRGYILSEYKDIKQLDIRCDTINAIIYLNIKFKWHRLFGRAKIKEIISDFFTNELPPILSIEDESIGKIDHAFKYYKVIYE